MIESDRGLARHPFRWLGGTPQSRSKPRIESTESARVAGPGFAYLCADTVEDRIAAILEEKKSLFADLIDGVSTSSLGRLDLDNLLHAAAPAF